MRTAKTQKSSDGVWHDEKGLPCHYKHVSKLDRFIEKGSGQLLKKAVKASDQLSSLKTEIRDFCDEVFLQSMIEAGTEDASKGNFVKYNFDRSIKIEVDVKDRMEFDDLTIIASKTKFDEFLSEKITSENEVIKQMVMAAFETTRGKFDVKKVLGLLRYESKIKDERFQSACKSLKDSIRYPSSKSYFRISVKNDEGGYDQIQLNFSAV